MAVEPLQVLGGRYLAVRPPSENRQMKQIAVEPLRGKYTKR